MNAQTVLSVLWLLQQLGAKAAQVHLAILVFHECPTNQDLVMNMFAVCQVNMLVLASTWNLSDYAASLSGAYQQVFGGDIAQMQILADLLQMGTRGHLKARQLRALRQFISTAPRPASLPDLLTNVMSPPNADKQSQELLEEATQCLRICMIRHEKGNKTADQFETALANLVSIFGPDLSFFGVVLPVMLRLVGTAQEEGRVALAALAATWSASCVPGRSRQAHVPSQQMLPLVLLELRTSFDTPHANFLQQLVSDNTVSLTRLLEEVCEPILRDLTINQWGQAAAASFVQMLAGFLGRPPDHNQSAWRQLAGRQPLYRRSEGFPTLLSVLKEVSNLLQASCNTESVRRTQLADLYQGIVREPAYQDCILQHMQHQLLSGTMPSTWREANCLWDTLHFVIESCITSSSNADAELTVHDNPIDPTAIRSILQAGAYSTFVSSVARWYFKVLLLRLDRDADSDDVQPANNRHGQTAFLASQCLQFLLEATQKELEEHVAMFSEHIGRDVSSLHRDVQEVG